MNPDDSHYTDKRCRFHATCAIDSCGGVATCPDGWEKPLFVPLANQWYRAFAEGRKRIEFRPAGIVVGRDGVERRSPWNVLTCHPGRPALLSNGYQVAGRLEATIVSYSERPDAGETTEAFDRIYPGHRARGGQVSWIEFEDLLPGTKSQQVHRIGNSVCPHVAAAVVRANLPEKMRKTA